MQFFGLLNVNKPPGITSRRVVDRIQRLVKPVKVGHAGTLDPLASGVLVLGLGHATRLVEYVQQMPKRYVGTFLLGRSSTTEDIEGEITELVNPVIPTRETLDQAARELTGEIMQRPPDFSALKVGGRRAYALARAGKEVELSARPVRIDRLEILSYDYPELRLDVGCGGGTYIRSLGRDLAERAGSAAVMSALERTAIGCFNISTAVDPEEITLDNLSEHLLSPLLAVRGQMEEFVATPDEARRIANGLSLLVPQVSGETCAALDADGRLLAILKRRATGDFRADKNFPQTG